MLTELRVEIETGPLASELAAAANDAARAAILNDKRLTTVKPTEMVNARILMSRIGAIEGAAFLDALEAAKDAVPAIKWALDFLRSEGGINVGDPVTRGMLDFLSSAQGGSIVTAQQRDDIKALANEAKSRADILFQRDVTAEEVTRAMKDWQVTFTPHRGRETIGDIEAVYRRGTADEFTYRSSVNLDVTSTVTHFIDAAKAALAARDAQAQSAIETQVVSITDQLNAG